MGVLNGLAMFVIVGIGVDDILIYFHHFLQNAKVRDMKERMVGGGGGRRRRRKRRRR